LTDADTERTHPSIERFLPRERDGLSKANRVLAVAGFAVLERDLLAAQFQLGIWPGPRLLGPSGRRFDSQFGDSQRWAVLCRKRERRRQIERGDLRATRLRSGGTSQAASPSGDPDGAQHDKAMSAVHEVWR